MPLCDRAELISSIIRRFTNKHQDDFTRTEPIGQTSGYSLGEYPSTVRVYEQLPLVMSMMRTPHGPMERTRRTGRMKQHGTIPFDHIRPTFVRINVCGSSVYKVPGIIKFPTFYGLERTNFQKLGIQYPRLRARLVWMTTPPLVRTLARPERCGSRLRFEIRVTVVALCLGFDPVDGSEPPQLLIMTAAQAFSGPHLETSVSRAKVAVRYEIIHHVVPF